MKAILFVNTTYNNTITTLTDKKGNTIYWFSSGRGKFKGSKKSTNFAAQISAEKISNFIKKKKIKQIKIITKGPGNCRDSIIRTINKNRIKITSIKDNTFTPHNGCRPPKRRRI
ncbi:MAG: 30S ribosomal protein S11 [Candidatus Vidania fulgoroideorum]